MANLCVVRASQIALIIALGSAVVTAVGAQNPTVRTEPERSTPSPTARTAPPAPPRAPAGASVRATQSPVDESVPEDGAVTAILKTYTAQVRALNAPLGKLAGDLKKEGMGGGALGNFVADAIRARAALQLGRPVLLAVTNTGGMRKNFIAGGSLRTIDIYELLPFENSLVALELTGEQLLRLLEVVVAKRDAQSGAHIIYRTDGAAKNSLVSVKLGAAEGRVVDPAATYNIVTIDYLLKRGGDYAVLQEAKNIRPLGLTLRDAVVDYVRAETKAGRSIDANSDGRFTAGEAAAETNQSQKQ